MNGLCLSNDAQSSPGYRVIALIGQLGGVRNEYLARARHPKSGDFHTTEDFGDGSAAPIKITRDCFAREVRACDAIIDNMHCVTPGATGKAVWSIVGLLVPG